MRAAGEVARLHAARFMRHGENKTWEIRVTPLASRLLRPSCGTARDSLVADRHNR